MTGLIKATAASAELVQAALGGSIESERRTIVTGKEPDVHPLQREIERLHDALAKHDTAIAGHAEALQSARSAGEAAGREAAQEEWVEDHSAALERLEAGLLAAKNSLGVALEQAQALALLVARAALDNLFGDPGSRNETLAALLARQLDRVGRELVVVVEVSRLDFPDTRELAALGQRIGLAKGQLTSLIDLPSAACRMRLRLGTIDLGIDRQWGAVRALIDEFCMPLPDSTA